MALPPHVVLSSFRWCISTRRSENTPKHVSIDLMAKRLRNDSCDAGIAESWIAAFDCFHSATGLEKKRKQAK